MLPPLVWVLVETGQLVTVVYTTSVVMTLLVETCGGAVVVLEDLLRCLRRVTVDEALELEGALDVEDTEDVGTELEAE